MRHDTAKEFQEESTQEAGIFIVVETERKETKVARA